MAQKMGRNGVLAMAKKKTLENLQVEHSALLQELNGLEQQ